MIDPEPSLDGGATDSGAIAEARWVLDQGPRALEDAPEWISAPSLASHGDEVALTFALTDADGRTTRLEAYVESPWVSAWPASAWAESRPLSDLDLESASGRPYATAWDGESFDTALRREGQTWGLTRLRFDAAPTPPVFRWADIAPWLVVSDGDSGHIVVARGDGRSEAWMHREGRSIRVHAGCDLPVAAAATSGRRWIAIARTPCGGELGLTGADLHELDAAGAIVGTSRIPLSRPEHTRGIVRTLSMRRANAGLWIAATTFEGAAGRGNVDRISVTWRGDGEEPRVVYEHLEQSGETVDAVSLLGDRLVLSHGTQDHFGDELFTLVVVSRDGAVARLAERTVEAFECARPDALLGSPNGRELLVVSRPEYDGPLSIARLRER